jgi:hypothetical protein
MDRALRRHLSERQKARVMRWLVTWQEISVVGVVDLWKDRAFVGKLARSPHLCSCYMCRNRRKLEGPKASELRRLASLE